MSTYTASQNTKMKIIEAAGTLVAELGFSNVSTRAIAERSGENIGSIHYHFGGKDGLLEAMVKEAMTDCIEHQIWRPALELDADDVTPEKISAALREIIKQTIQMIFRSDKPQWHMDVIYQLLDLEGPLTNLFEQDVMVPDRIAMNKLFRLVNPKLSDEDIFLHSLLMKMPILSHVNHKTVIMNQLGITKYSDEYLQKMEDLLVRQTQLLLGLPEDKTM